MATPTPLTTPRGRTELLLLVPLSVALILSLVPAPGTRTAVVFCTAGAALCLAAGALLARIGPGRAAATRIQQTVTASLAALQRPGPGLFCLALGAVSVAISATSATVLLERVPGVFDGALYLFQAKIFAMGSVATTPPALPEFFKVPFSIIDDGRWYSHYPPGFPAVLSIGVKLGAPWLVNPVVTALNAALVYGLARDLYSELEARLAALIAGLAPLAIFMSSDYVSNPTCLLFATAFMWAAVSSIRGRTLASIALAGLTGGACFATRPYTAVAILLVFALLAGGDIAKRLDWRAALVGALAAALPLIGFGLYNLGTTGDVFLLGYTKLHGAKTQPGFGITQWGANEINYLLQNFLRNTNSLNKDLFQLPFPALLLPVLAMGLRRPSRWDVAMLLSFLSLLGFHYFFWGTSHYLGPRYLFEGVSVLAILSARGLTAVRAQLAVQTVRPRTRQTLALAVAGAVCVGLPVALGARALAVARGYSDPAVLVAVDAAGLDDALVFIPFEEHAPLAAAFSENVPHLDGPVVYARDLGPADNPRLALLYPTRTAWCWESGRLVPLDACGSAALAAPSPPGPRGAP